MAPAQRVLPVFVEVNIGGEDQKSGALPGARQLLVAHLLDQCPHLQFCGLMTVPPYDPDPGARARTSRLCDDWPWISRAASGCPLSGSRWG